MSGGPINGVSVLSMLSAAVVTTAGSLTNIVGGAIASVGSLATGAVKELSDNDPMNYLGVIVPTVLNISRDAVEFWTGMTCLFDDNWSSETAAASSGKATLPLCMFHVTKITTTRATDISEKRIVLYEPQADGGETINAISDKLRANTLKTIVDNVVVKPAQYTVEAIVPFRPLGRYITETLTTAASVLGDIINLAAGDNSVSKAIHSITGAAAASVKAVQSVLGTINFADDGDTKYININSLEAMAESGHILRMKLWTGYNYKYVMLTGLTTDKRPTEDDVFRVSMALREIPVLNVTKPSVLTTAGTQGAAVLRTVDELKKLKILPLAKAVGVDEEMQKMG